MIKIPPRPFARANPLQTPRLRLLPIDPSDSKELFRSVEESRAHLYPWLPWVPFHRDEPAARRFAEACAADWDAGRAIRFIIRERKSGDLLGVVGLETCVHIHASCELGYWLREDVQKKGYMTEAAGAVLRAAFQQFGMHRVRVAAATSNHPSLAVIARLGFRFEGIAREAEFCAGRWLDHAQFGMLASDLDQPK